MDFRILGPLEVRDRGRPVQLRRRKPRALLALLLLRPGEPVSSDALIDALWGEDPPRTARAALQNYVAQLRSALGPGVLVSQGGGYLLDVSSEQIDLGRFERLTGEGRAAEGEDRVEKLQEALALWRGPPLADLAFEPFAALETPGLEELRTAALEDLIEARLLLGAGPELVPELEQLVADYPFRERLRGQLMLALYRGGRQADALEAYQETRHTLVDELGIEPSAPLRQLEQAILRQEAWLNPALQQQIEAPPEERRKTVTILFADIDCPETIDPELLRKATVIALARVRALFEAHGATIEQRAGDEVLAVFGIPQAHEDDPVRAVRAALELTAAEWLDSVGVELRFGIETGEVLTGVDETGHGFAAGPVVTLAKGMLQRAGPGEVLLGPTALRVLGAAVVAEPTQHGDALVLELAEDVSAPPRRLEAPFVDRGAELDLLRRAFADAVDARSCRVFLLLGEAGIGKTRLATELAAELDGAATFFTGRCVSYGKGATYLPLAEIVRQVGERHVLNELLAGDEHADLISTRLADLTGDAETPGSGGETFWAARRLFESLADERPLVLVFEDLHWAEPTLLDLIDYFAERVSAAPILLLGLARSELLEMRTGWRENEAATLAPLSGQESEMLIENLGEAPGQLRTQILRTAGGNPLFLEQLLAHAGEGGEPETVPPSLEALLASRLDLLEPGELSVLQRAAVAGRDFSRDAVVHLLAQEASAADKLLDGVAQKGLIRGGDGRFRFHHVLIRDAAYATLPKAQRADLHERFGRWLESRPARSDELVGFHLEQAYEYLLELGAVDDRITSLAVEAGARLGAAGLRAWRRADVAATVNLLGRAVELLPRTDPTRLELSCELGLALRTAGEFARAAGVLRDVTESAAAEGEEGLELRARLELANVRLSSHPEGSADELLALATEAIRTFEGFGDDRSLGRAWLLLGYVHGGLHCQNAEWTRAAERALVHYRRSRWPTAACFGEIATSLYYGPTPVPEAIRRCEELLADVADLGGEAHVLVWLGGLEAYAGRLDRGRELVNRARALLEELGYRMVLAYACGPVLAEIELLAGRPGAAEESLRASCAVLEAAQEAALLASRASELAEAIYRQGRYDEAETWARLSENHAATDDVGAQFLRRALEAKVLARRESFAEAERMAREALALAERTDAVNSRAKVLLDLAEVLRLCGKSAEASEVVVLALEHFERKGNRVGGDHARRLLSGGGPQRSSP